MSDNGVPDDAPITEVLPALRAARSISAENLAFEARTHMADGFLSTSLISKIETGKRNPTPGVMEALAAALEVDPAVFAEYRLARMRRLFDEREMGLEAALANATALFEALGGEGLPAAPAGLQRELKNVSPTSTGPARAASPRTRRSTGRQRPA